MDPLAGLDDIPWARLQACRGNAEWAPDALRMLASDDVNARESAWDYLQDVLWQRGAICEATGPALPFILRLALREGQQEPHVLVEYCAVAAGSARREPQSPSSRSVQEHLARCLPELTQLLANDVTRGCAALVCGCMDTPAAALLVEKQLESADAPQLYVALVLHKALPASVENRALEHLASGENPLSVACAYLLAMTAKSLPDDVKARVDALATPGRIRKFAEHWGADWIDLPMPRLAPPTGPLEAASVVFSSSNMVVVNHPARGRYTLRIRDTQLKAGDTVMLGAFEKLAQPIARIAEFTAPDGTTHRYEFDELGTITASQARRA